MCPLFLLTGTGYTSLPFVISTAMSPTPPASSVTAPGKMLNGTHYIFTGPDDCEVVVCIHGVGSFHGYYTQGLSKVLEEAGFRVLVYDLIGRGFSDIPTDGLKGPDKSPYGRHGHLAQLRALIVGLGLSSSGSQYHVIGHSMGGAIATMYASEYYQEIKSLALVAPAGLMDMTTLKLLRTSPIKRLIAWGMRAHQYELYKNDFYDKKCPGALQIKAALRVMYDHNSNSFDAFWQCLLHFPFSGIEPSISVLVQQKIPVYIMWGKHDVPVPYKPSYERWRSLLAPNPNFESVVFDHLGHAPYLEDPDHVNPMVRTFLTKHKSPA